MVESGAARSNAYIHYSPSHKMSIGLDLTKDKIDRTKYANARITYLLNRRNTKHSQRNLYVQAGVSSKGLDNYFLGVNGDWETRRVFGGFWYRYTRTDKYALNERSFQWGIAPYIGNYGDLHTWIMVKIKNDNKKNFLISDSTMSNWDAYPMLKLFKGPVLFEVGYSKESNINMHFMYRF